VSIERVDLEALLRRHTADFPRLVESLRPYRGHQRPRDREETEVLIELACRAWRSAEAEGHVSWRADRTLELRLGIFGPAGTT